MRIAIFDYKVISTNPAGSCHLDLVAGLSQQHDFTVFAVEFSNPCPDRVAWIRIPVPSRPLALLFVAYHVVAPLRYLERRLRGATFDLVQQVESNLSFGDISYTHFCHRHFLRHGGGKQLRASGLRGLFRWLDHRLHAAVEPWTFRRASVVVVPSQGLARDLVQEYPLTADKVVVIPNPVDLHRLKPSHDFDRRAQRSLLRLQEEDIAIIFVALGNFEHKGLPLLLDALQDFDGSPLRLIVVGGKPDLVRAYRRTTNKMGLSRITTFVGIQRDVRPFLWASDLFALPSAGETFSLAAWQAAGSGLPLLVTDLQGLQGLVVDGKNGIVVESTPAGVAAGLRRYLELSDGQRRQLGEQARMAVQHARTDSFLPSWSKVYKSVFRTEPAGQAPR